MKMLHLSVEIHEVHKGLTELMYFRERAFMPTLKTRKLDAHRPKTKITQMFVIQVVHF